MPDSTPRQLVPKRLAAETQAENEWSALDGLERRGRSSSRVPQGDDLHLAQAWGQAVVHVVADTREVNAAHGERPATGYRSAAGGLVSDEGQRAYSEIVAQGIWAPRGG